MLTVCGFEEVRIVERNRGVLLGELSPKIKYTLSQSTTLAYEY